MLRKVVIHDPDEILLFQFKGPFTTRGETPEHGMVKIKER